MTSQKSGFILVRHVVAIHFLEFIKCFRGIPRVHKSYCKSLHVWKVQSWREKCRSTPSTGSVVLRGLCGVCGGGSPAVFHLVMSQTLTRHRPPTLDQNMSRLPFSCYVPRLDTPIIDHFQCCFRSENRSLQSQTPWTCLPTIHCTYCWFTNNLLIKQIKVR